jgi:hypothetical protein
MEERKRANVDWNKRDTRKLKQLNDAQKNDLRALNKARSGEIHSMKPKC